jgi:two-component system, OmpR family, KDP operon response regulator KdpE
VTKPFAMGELLARLRAALRRDEAGGHEAHTVAAIGSWAINLSAHTIQRSQVRTEAADSPVPRLTPTEWRILGILLRRPGQLVSAAQLLAGVWGPGFQNRTNYLRFHMARLRRKLEEDPSRPRYLLTEPGMGYRYQP